MKMKETEFSQDNGIKGEVIQLKHKRNWFDQLPDKKQKRLLNIELDLNKELIKIKASIYEVGRLLYTAKNELPHGQYEVWIGERFGDELSYPTVANYKGIYEMFKDSPETVNLLPLTLLLQIKQESFPDEIRKLINDNPKAFRNVDIAKFKRIFSDYKGGKINMAQFEKLAKKHIETGITLLKGQRHLRNSIMGKKIIKSGFVELKSAIRTMRRYSWKIRTFFPSAKADARNANVDTIN
jgi:hypothetical protein